MVKLSVRQVLQVWVLMVLPLPALALPFNSLDARSMALGGAGVASSNSAGAAVMNPALLATDTEQGMVVQFPVLGVRYRDPNNMLDDVDSYQTEELELDLDAAVDAFNQEASNTNVAALGNAASFLSQQINRFSRAPIHGEMFGGLVVAMPDQELGMAVSITSWAIAGGQLNVTPHDIELLDELLENASAGTLALATNPYIEEHLEKRRLEADDELDGEEDLKTVAEQLNSTMQVRGMALTELAFSFAKKVKLYGYEFDLGVTPKYVKVTAFDYADRLDDARFVSPENTRKHSNLNVDLGFARDYGSGWRSGISIENLFKQRYRTGTGSNVEIEPQLRIGVSHKGEWHMLTADLDILENDAVGYEEDSRFLALGGELALSDLVTMRAGYRHNISKPETSVPSLGIGLDVGVRMDLAVAATEDDIAAAFQLGFEF